MSREHIATTATTTTTVASQAGAWLWVAVWALLIWGLGGEALSHESTSRFLGPLIRWLLPGVSDATCELVQFSIRKSAHATEYSALGFFLFRALSLNRSFSLGFAALAALCLAATFAAADETRQNLSATRNGSFWDGLLDSSGAAAGIGLLLWAREWGWLSGWARVERPGFDSRVGLAEAAEPASVENTPRGIAE